MAIYYLNTFNVPNTDNRHFAIWEVKFNPEKTRHYLPEAFKWYTWIKKIYDPHGHFKKNYELDPSPETIIENEREVIKKIFEITIELKAINPKTKITL